LQVYPTKIAELEEIKRHWLFAADSMPQLICLVNRDGRIIRANRTLERWGLGRVEKVRGVSLHDALHQGCSEPECYLRHLWQRSALALARDGRAECKVSDPLLQRHFNIQMRKPVQLDGAGSEGFFASVTIDDVSDLKAKQDESIRKAQELSQRIEREERRLEQSEKIQSRLLSIMSRTPSLIAMADPDGALIYLNQAGRTLLGMGLEDKLDGLTLIGCQAPGARERLSAEILPIAERDGQWSGESVLLSRDEREIKCFVTLIACCDAKGTPEGYCLQGRDMTEWVRIEEALQLTRREVWRLSSQHLTIQESERRRIAADLHDGLGQTLSLMKLSLEDVARSARNGMMEKVTASLERLTPTVKSALTELRRISMNLRPATLDDLGILATLAWYFREVDATCPNLVLERDIGVKESDVAEPLKIAIFRIVQEATNNALKHARAGRIKVSFMNEGDALELLIEDTGRGFDMTAVADSREVDRGIGLQSMRERAELSGASFRIESAPGKGTSICVHWPTPESLERKKAAAHPPTIQSVPQSASPDGRMPDRWPASAATIKKFGR